MRVFPTVRLGSGKQQQPAEPTLISQRMLCFRRGFGLGANLTRRCFLIKASVVSGKKSCGRAGASWALLSRAPWSHPGFTPPSQNEQTQPRPCCSVLGLGWYSAHNAISRRRQGPPFCSGVQVDRGRGQCLPQPRGDPTGSLHTARALGWGLMGNCPSFSGIPLASANAATSWRKTASDCPFLHKDVSASPGRGTWRQANVCPMDRWPRSCCPLGPRGSGQACLQPRLLPQSGACTPALVVPWCLLSSQASDSLHRERVTLVLPPACCSCHGRLSCFTAVSRQQGQWLLLFSRAACCAFPRHAAGERGDIRVPFLKAVSTWGNHVSLSGRGNDRAQRILLHAGL